jgi:tRNA pseudouridine38-40 synthase
VLCVEAAPAGFHPQLHAVRKLYRYTMSTAATEMPRLRRVFWNAGGPVDVPAMRAGAAHLVGTQDFRAFRSDPGPRRRGETTVRTIESIELRADGELVTLDVVGPGFLYMMVRNVTSALVAVGRGAKPPGWIADVLALRDRSLLPPPAPAHGLTLVRVEYADGFGA